MTSYEMTMSKLKTHQSEGISLARFVLDRVNQSQALVGEHTSDSDLREITIREVRLSLPYVEQEGQLPLQQQPLLDLSLPEAQAYLFQHDHIALLEVKQLAKLPVKYIKRLTIRIRLP